MDLIAGLPGDTPAGFRGSLEAVAALGPEKNITIHTLALKKGADLYQHPENLPNTGGCGGDGPVLPGIPAPAGVSAPLSLPAEVHVG